MKNALNIDQNQAEMDAQLRIQTLSTVAKWCARFGLFAFALAMLFLASELFFDPSELEELFDQKKLPNGFIGGLPFVVRSLLFVVAVASMFPAVIGFCVATELFSSFSKGEVFTSDAAGKISLIGWALVALPLANTIGNLLISGILLLFKTMGTVSVTIDFDEGDMMAVVFGLLFVILGRVMREAAKLSEENKQFV